MSFRILRPGMFRAVLFASKTSTGIFQPRVSSSAVATQIDRWKKANELYYGPDRDTKNFPHPAQGDKGGKVRMGFVPEEFFTFLYPKTGVTGPYLLGTGFFTFLLSKEIWVVDHGFADVCGFAGAIIFLTWKLGPRMSKFLDEMRDRYLDVRFNKPLETAKAVYQEKIDNTEKTIWQQEGQKYLFQVKEENILLQLEATYRKRLNDVYAQVKNRLDYQVEVENTKRRFEQEHMVKWIVDNVVKSITPQQEKESINRCLQDLRVLAKA